MNIDPRAGMLIEPLHILDLAKLLAAYFDRMPDISVATQQVSFGTSGHRDSAFNTTLKEDHILAIA